MLPELRRGKSRRRPNSGLLSPQSPPLRGSGAVPGAPTTGLVAEKGARPRELGERRRGYESAMRGRIRCGGDDLVCSLYSSLSLKSGE